MYVDFVIPNEEFMAQAANTLHKQVNKLKDSGNVEDFRKMLRIARGKQHIEDLRKGKTVSLNSSDEFNLLNEFFNSRLKCTGEDEISLYAKL